MPNDRSENLFKDSTMTFGEHLEELRVCLFRAIIGLVIGIIIGLLPFVGPRVVEFIQRPLQEALGDYYAWRSAEKIDELEASGVLTTQEAADQKELSETGWILDEQFVARDVLADQGVDVQRNPSHHKWNRYGPNQIVVLDLQEPEKICQQITAAGNGTAASPKRRVWELLSEERRASLTQVADTSDRDSDLPERLASSLDELIARDDFYQSESFKSVTLNGEAKRYLPHREELAEPELRRFNRLLLEAAFPDEIVPTYPALIYWPTWTRSEDDPRTRTSALAMHEPFMIYIKAALLTGVLISSPWVFLQLWLFVAAGLYPHERRYVHIFLPFSLGLFLAGAALAFFFVFRPVLTFLLSFNAWMGIDAEPRISEWMSFVVLLPLGFGISFQLPLVMLFLERIGVFNVKVYKEKWRIAILVIAVIAMLLTPMDPTSMILMQVPLTVLYGLGILLCIYMPKRKNPFEEA